MEPSHLAVIHAVFEACGLMLTVLLALHAYNVRKGRRIEKMLLEWQILKIEHRRLLKWWCLQQNPPIELTDLETRDEHGEFLIDHPSEGTI